MDDLRGSFSKLKKDIKYRLTGSKRKADKTGHGESAEPSGSLPQPDPDFATDRKKSGWKSTAPASAKLLLRGVRDSADAFPPLKSVAGGLCFILENCEVRSPPSCPIHYLQRSPVSQRTKANKQAIESLAPRVKALAERLCEPVPKGDIKERERRKRLEQ